MTAITRSGRFSKCLVYLLVAALTNVSVVGKAAVQAPATESQVDTWNQVLGLPTGTHLELALADGSEVTGTLVEKRAEVIVVNKSGTFSTPTMTIPRSSVVTVSVLKIATAYSATGVTDVDVLRQVVTALGIGKKVELKTAGTKRLRGTIQSIEQDGFTVIHGPQGKIDHMAYGEVSQVRPAGMRKAAKVAITAGAAGAIGIWVFVLGLAANSQ